MKTLISWGLIIFWLMATAAYGQHTGGSFGGSRWGSGGSTGSRPSTTYSRPTYSRPTYSRPTPTYSRPLRTTVRTTNSTPVHIQRSGGTTIVPIVVPIGSFHDDDNDGQGYVDDGDSESDLDLSDPTQRNVCLVLTLLVFLFITAMFLMSRRRRF